MKCIKGFAEDAKPLCDRIRELFMRLFAHERSYDYVEKAKKIFLMPEKPRLLWDDENMFKRKKTDEEYFSPQKKNHKNFLKTWNYLQEIPEKAGI